MRKASTASKRSPVRSHRMALPQPAISGSRIGAPPTGKMPRLPGVVMGVAYWEPLLRFARDSMLAEGTIEEGDVDFFLTDRVSVALGHLGEA